MVERILKKLGKIESDGSNPQRPQTGVLLMLTSCSRAPLETGSGAGEEDAKLRKAKNKHFYWYQVHLCWKIAKLVFKKKKTRRQVVYQIT